MNCVDIDECTEVNRCDLEHSVCVNHDGGYKCQCHVGYKDQGFTDRQLGDRPFRVGPRFSNFVMVRSVLVRGSLAKIVTIRSKEVTNTVMTVSTSMNVTLGTTLVMSMPIVETLTDHMTANAK